MENRKIGNQAMGNQKMGNRNLGNRKMPNRKMGSEEIENLFLVGAGTHPGAGVPAVLTSAQILEEVVPLATVTV